MLGDAPGNRNPIVGRGTATNLVQQDQASIRYISYYGSRIVHVHHQSGLPSTEIIRSSETSKDLIGHGDLRLTGRNERTHMGHQCDQGRLTKQGTLTAHVRSRENNDLLIFLI